MELEKIKCDFCGSEGNKTRYIKDGYNIVQCDNCSLVFVNPRLTEKAVHALYNEEYFHGGGFDKSVEYKKEFDEKSGRKDLIDWDLSAIGEMLKTEGKQKLLDAGCGMGLFLWKAKVKGFDVEGLELSEYAADFVRSKGIDVRNESVEIADLPPESYDVIVMREVIEHLREPGKTLERVYKALKKGGVLFMTTGNYDCPERKLRGKEWFYFMPEGHLYIFSNKTMQEYLKKTGFSGIKVTNQGDLLMNKLFEAGIIDPGKFIPGGLKRIPFALVRGVNHFISSGMRIYAVK